MSGNDEFGRKRKNPWGNNAGGGNDDRGGNRKPPQGPWGSGNGGGKEPPDFDDLINKAQRAMRDILPSNMSGGMLTILVIAILFVLWMSSGLFIISPGEHGVIQRFGAWSRTQVGEGLSYHLPAPLEKVTKVNVNELKRMEIGFTESFPRGSTTMKRDVLEESLMLTSDRNIVDLHMVIQWDIKSAEDFLFNIQDQEGTIKKVAESAIREVVGQTDMFQVITTGRASVAAKAKDIIQKNLDEYHSGVNIRQVLIQKAEVHPEVQQAFQDVQSAKQDAENTINEAEVVRQDILPKARGQATKILQDAEAYKQSQIAKAKGDAERFKSVYAAYVNGKDVTKERIFIETMEEVLKNAEKIVMDNKGGNGVVPYLPLNAMGSTTAKTEEGSLKQ